MDNDTHPAALRDAVKAHVERYLGRIARTFADDSERGIEILHCGPTDKRPYHTLVSCGMSATQLPRADDSKSPHRLELMFTLPEDWPLDDGALRDPNRLWPLTKLRELARLPSQGASLGWGSVVPNGEPPTAYAPETQLCGVILAPSLLVPMGFYELESGSQRTAFYAAIPLYRQEIDLHRREGMKVLLGRLADRDVDDVVRPRRRNAAKRFLGLF